MPQSGKSSGVERDRPEGRSRSVNIREHKLDENGFVGAEHPAVRVVTEGTAYVGRAMFKVQRSPLM
jgi:hypothetical protein